MIFDTGVTDTFVTLFSGTVRRLGLKEVHREKELRINGGDLIGQTQQYPFTCLGTTSVIDFAVYDKPPFLPDDGDGVLPYWPFADNIWVIDLPRHIFSITKSQPVQMENFVRAKIIRDVTRILTLEIPDSKRGPVLTSIDTGQDSGITIPRSNWKTWLSEHPNQPTTLEATYMPSYGLSVIPVAWADEFRIGDVVFHNVPIKEATPGEESNSADTYIIGLYAVARMALVLDGSNLTAYLQPATVPPPAFTHNRLGAVFVPKDEQSNDLVAYIAKGSPAEAAGLVQGDVLIKIDSIEVADWRTVPGILPLSRFWDLPAGTKHTLKVRRAEKTLTVKVVLRDILAPKL